MPKTSSKTMRLMTLGLSFCCFLLSQVQRISATTSSSSQAAADPDFGSLKLCPPGGSNFNMAWNLACEMKKRKKRDVIPEYEQYVPRLQRFLPSAGQNRERRAMMMEAEGRPATLEEIMKICCRVGCEIRDLLAYCDPFGPWNS